MGSIPTASTRSSLHAATPCRDARLGPVCGIGDGAGAAGLRRHGRASLRRAVGGRAEPRVAHRDHAGAGDARRRG